MDPQEEQPTAQVSRGAVMRESRRKVLEHARTVPVLDRQTLLHFEARMRIVRFVSADIIEFHPLDSSTFPSRSSFQQDSLDPLDPLDFLDGGEDSDELESPEPVTGRCFQRQPSSSEDGDSSAMSTLTGNVASRR